jgi:glyceraldehyde-3-phosphate dehydrogenase (NADP+)
MKVRSLVVVLQTWSIGFTIFDLFQPQQHTIVGVSGQSYHQQCDIFATEMPKAPYIAPDHWDLPKSANTNWSEHIEVRVLSYSGYNESTSYCDATTGEPIIDFVTTQVGSIPQFMDDEAVNIINEASKYYNGGNNQWTSQTTLPERIEIIRHILADIKRNRDEIIRLLMWEISKNYDDAAAEIDETLEFFDQLVITALDDPQYTTGQWQDIPSGGNKITTALTKRTALGVVLISSYNFPISDVYRILLPALLMGNVCILKIPSIGGLIHYFTQDYFAAHLPSGALYLASSPGPMLLTAMLQTGKVDALALVGGTVDPTNELLTKHPHPHKFKTFLQLTAKNVAIVLPDIFDPKYTETLYENALKESVKGSFTYSGQLNTALKVYFVPKLFADQFALDIAERVEKVSIGLPWQKHTIEDGTTEYSQITPLPFYPRLQDLGARLGDATKKGARIINDRGGTRIGVKKSTLLRPSVVYPLKSHMKFYHEDATGPVILIAPYDNIEEAYEYIDYNQLTQQISIFGQNTTTISNTIDRLGAIVGRININTHCTRAPDTIPFTNRRSTGMGIMSISDILKELSIPTVLSHKSHDLNEVLVEELRSTSFFLGAKKKEGSAATSRK